MKNIWIIVIIAGIVLIGVAYFMMRGNNTSQPTTTPDPIVEDTNTETLQSTVTLSEQNASGQSGTATLVEENGQVTVTLTTTGFEEGVEQPAHIHAGTCPDVGAVSYPLTNVVDGTSVTTLDVTLAQLSSELPLGINVHESTDNPQNYTACGDLLL